MKKLTFDEFKDIVDAIDTPAQRLGIFRVKLANCGKRYYWESLKVSTSYNSDIYGFSLNHYGWMNLPKQQFLRSQFHDEEDVCIDIERDKFLYAIKTDGFNEIQLSMKTWWAQINW
mgnify:CR=1 FL=1